MRRPTMGRNILLGAVSGFKTSPRSPSISIICRHTAPDTETHECKTAVFGQNAKPPIYKPRSHRGLEVPVIDLPHASNPKYSINLGDHL